MKKTLSYLVACTLFITACNKSVVENQDDASAFETNSVSQRECGAMEVLQQDLLNDPQLQNRMNAIERFTQNAIQSGIQQRLVNGVIEIPCVVNVIYKTSTQNISDAQIQSQIDVLNEDFNLNNADHVLTPSNFSGVKANVGIRFVLEKTVRKYSSKRSWSTNNDMKKSSKGGIDPTTPTTHLNLWVVNSMTSGGQTILGYAQFPGGASATDGVVIGYNFFGRVGTLSAPFNKGRTATHEVGHWMNLRHIWGDATCGTDYVDDTPLHNTANYGCPAAGHKSTCTGTPVEMTMNYMDYTDDNCMYMFSNGQKSRMLAIFAAGGPRALMGQ
jgi:hypothetical protein